MGGVEVAKIDVYLTKCFWHGRRKRLLLLSVLRGRFQKAWFLQWKSCVSCPRRDNEIQLIASGINSLRQVRMIILKRSNYKWEGLIFAKMNMHFTKCFWHGRRKRLLLLRVLRGRFQKACFLQWKSGVSCPRRDSINCLRDQLLETSSYDSIKKKQL